MANVAFRLYAPFLINFAEAGGIRNAQEPIIIGIEAEQSADAFDTLYVSTGGGWSPNTDALLRIYAQTPGLHLIAATDRNRQGEVYVERLHGIAKEAGCRFSRLTPKHEDWNEDLKALPQRLGSAKNGEVKAEGK